MKLTRPDPILFELADGRAFLVEPCTRGQLRAALALDPEPGEMRAPGDVAAQRALQLAELVGPVVRVGVRGQETGSNIAWDTVPSAPLLAGLTPAEEMQILAALVAQGHGQNPADAAALQKLAQKKSLFDALTAFAPSMPTPPPSPPSSAAPSNPPNATATSPA